MRQKSVPAKKHSDRCETARGNRYKSVSLFGAPVKRPCDLKTLAAPVWRQRLGERPPWRW